MRYVSTRGQTPARDFASILLAGLADDGGLFMPEHIEPLDGAQIEAMKSASYESLAVDLIGYFAAGSIPADEISAAVRSGLSHFDHPEIAPLTRLRNGPWLLELFHGPTLAFKDYALQFVSELISRQLQRTGRNAMVLCATSGDTGAAAAAAFAGRERVKAVVLHPHGRVSDVQRRQMTTISDDNVLNIAVDGDFDDCQAMVKAMFQHDGASELGLTAVNSINWARIVSQVVYYAHSSLKLGADGPVNFVVPTGNFGNILAAEAARRLGFPIGRLTLSSNENDVLPRFFETGTMQRRETLPSLSPSMDIQVSSNFERALWWAMDGDAARVRAAQKELADTGRYTLDDASMQKLRANYSAVRCSREDAVAEIRRVFDETGIALCPHTATASFAARGLDGQEPLVVVATAHAAKFPVGVEAALGRAEPLPSEVEAALSGEERFERLPADNDALLSQLKEFA